MIDTIKSARIRQLNDELRTMGRSSNGRIMAVGTLGEEGPEKVERVWEACARITAWPKGDDPDGVRDFGKFEVDGENYVFKIYCYFKIDSSSADEMNRSECPDDPNTTIRVLALMYAEDY